MYWRLLLILALFPLLVMAKVTAPERRDVSLILDDVPVRQALQALAETGQRNLVIAPDVDGVVSLHLINVSWQQAFQAIMDSGQLHWRQQGGLLQIYSRQWLEQQREQQRQRQENRPLESQVIALRYASASDLAQLLTDSGNQLLSARGSVSGDKRTNRLLLQDTPQALAQIRQWIAQMDIPAGQVELAAYIVTMSQDSLRALGVKWATGGELRRDSPYGVRDISADLSISDASVRAGFSVGRLSGRLLELELSALERKNQLEIIANPRLIASHQQPASIKQGSEIPYQVSRGDNGATAIEFKEAVLGMEVTPSILPDGHIRLKLRISQNTPGRILKQAGGEVLAIDKQEIETQLEIQNGETIALGGIFQHKQHTGQEKLPLLAEIPLFGRLFRYQGDDQQRRQLVVFITPRILKSN